MKKEFKRILIVRTDRIGDVLLSTPVIKALREAYPKSYIAVMANPNTKEILDGNPYLNEIIILDKQKEHKGLIGSLRLMSSLRKRKFDLALILHGTKRVHVLALLSGIKERVGYNRKWGFLLTKKIPDIKPLGLKHELEYCLDLVRILGIEPKDKRTFFPINSIAENKIEQLFKEKIKAGFPVVCLHPGASCPSKRWLKERFAEVAKKLISEFNANIIIVGGKDENLNISNELDRLINEEHVLNLSGNLTIPELGSVLKRCDLFISNDSGPVHIAASVGIPVISIFGRSQAGLSPKRWRPVSENSVVLHKDIHCKICLAHNCDKNFACLSAVSADEVYAAAKDILSK